MTSSSASAFLALSLRSHGSHTLLMTAAIVAVYLRLREEEEKKKRKKKKKKRDHEETTASWEGTISSSESLPKMARTNHILRRHDRAAAVPVPQSIRVPIKPKATGRMAIPRVRKTIGHIHEQLGPAHFRRVYNLSLEEFRQLLRCIEPQLNQRKTTLRGRNGPVPFDTALSATLRFLRGDAVPQIMESHGVSRATLYDTLWQTIAAINECPALAFSSSAHHTVSPCHPDAEQQLQPQTTSPAGGEYRAECLGGMILSIDKPRQIDDYHYQHHRAAAASSSSALDGRHDIIMTTTTTTTNTNGPKTNPRHYYYYYYAGKGRKPTYGFNLQAICDAHGRFLTVSIQHPAAISKRASFRTSLSLTATTNTNNNNMTDGTGLAQNLAILGHSSCAVTAAAAVAATDDGTGGLSHPSITTPYISTTGGRNTSQSGARADFNYYHSQVTSMALSFPFILLLLARHQIIVWFVVLLTRSAYSFFLSFRSLPWTCSLPPSLSLSLCLLAKNDH